MSDPAPAIAPWSLVGLLSGVGVVLLRWVASGRAGATSHLECPLELLTANDVLDILHAGWLVGLRSNCSVERCRLRPMTALEACCACVEKRLLAADLAGKHGGVELR